jgi:MFS family permease
MTVTTRRLPRARGAAPPARAHDGPPAHAAASLARAGSSQGSLLTGKFRSVLLLALFGFGIEYILRTVIPLMVLARGGDAVMVGLLAGAFALPSIVFRPIVGRLVDTWQHRTLLRAGTVVAAVLPLFLLLPGIAATLVVRFFQGTGWAFYSVSNQSLMARIAPLGRRGEASGLYMMMPGLAALVGPAVGVALFASTGEVAPFLLASALGLAAFLVAARLPAPPAATPHPAGEAGTVQSQPRMRAVISHFVERSALPGTLMLITFGSASTLFSVFAPVYAVATGAPLAILVLYYPIYGLAQVLALPFGGRLSDRLGRRRSIGLGTVNAGSARALALGGGMVAFAVAAVIYALASALVNPAISAMTIERAPRARMGSAMATYSIGYQIANGLSSVLWGFLITAFGFPWPFLCAMAFQVVTLVLTRRGAGPLAATRSAAG